MTLPASIMSSELTIMGVTLVVHQLDNGQRIIEADGLNELFEKTVAGDLLPQDEADALAKALRS